MSYIIAQRTHAEAARRMARTIGRGWVEAEETAVAGRLVDSKCGRGDWIRTSDLLTPSQVLYRAEPRPEIGIVSRPSDSEHHEPDALPAPERGANDVR